MTTENTSRSLVAARKLNFRESVATSITPKPAAGDEAPKTLWERIFTSTPVAMTMVATLLAGLSTSEMTRAQYDRSLAAQLQSKAGDQWSFFQAKRLRGSLQQNDVDLLNLDDNRVLLTGAALKEAIHTVPGASADAAAVDALAEAKLPQLPSPVFPEALQKAVDAVAAQRPEVEIAALLKPIKPEELAAAVQRCKDIAAKDDVILQPILKQVEGIQTTVLTRTPSATTPAPADTRAPSLKRSVVAAKLQLATRRYEAEARLNQTLADVYELQVRASNLSADRHYLRSQRFFFGMLFAQFSVVMSTFAIAVRLKNTLWALAALAGVFAVAFALYVYLYV